MRRFKPDPVAQCAESKTNRQKNARCRSVSPDVTRREEGRAYWQDYARNAHRQLKPYLQTFHPFPALGCIEMRIKPGCPLTYMPYPLRNLRPVNPSGYTKTDERMPQAMPATQQLEFCPVHQLPHDPTGSFRP